MLGMSLTSLAQLSGTYTIDPNGTGTNNWDVGVDENKLLGE